MKYRLQAIQSPLCSTNTPHIGLIQCYIWLEWQGLCFAIKGMWSKEARSCSSTWTMNTLWSPQEEYDCMTCHPWSSSRSSPLQNVVGVAICWLVVLGLVLECIVSVHACQQQHTAFVVTCIAITASWLLLMFCWLLVCCCGHAVSPLLLPWCTALAAVTVLAANCATAGRCSESLLVLVLHSVKKLVAQ